MGPKSGESTLIFPGAPTSNRPIRFGQKLDLVATKLSRANDTSNVELKAVAG